MTNSIEILIQMNNSAQAPQSRKNRNSNRQTTRLSQRQRILIGAAISTFFVVLIIVFYQTFHSTVVKAAVTGDYRSRVSGSWSTASNWEILSGATWSTAATAPSSTSGAINIQSGHTMTVGTSVTVDQLTIDAGGTLTISLTKTLTVANGIGTDITNNGTITNSGTISLAASGAFANNSTITNNGTISLAASGAFVNNSTITNNWAFTNSGAITNAGTFINAATLTMNVGSSLANSANSIYRHAQNGGTITTATWAATSTCEVTGITGTIPSGLSQSFGNFTWNCSGQTGTLTLATSMTTQGDFSIVNTGAGNRLYLSNDNTVRSLTIGGNFIQSGGEFRLTNSTSANTMSITGNFNSTGGTFKGNNSSGVATINVSGGLNISGTASVILANGSSNSTMNVTGNTSITGGTLTMTGSTGTGTLNVAGNYTHTGGTVTKTGTPAGVINFNGSAMQTYTSGGTVTGAINFTVNNGAYLQMAAEATIVSGGGTFTVTNGGKLGIMSVDGILSSTALGNIQATGTRTFNTGADYIYNGTTAQTTGSGLPATTRNLTFNNTAGITISNSTAATGTLSLTNGIITTNTNELILGSGAVATLSRTNGYVLGNFKRWIAATTATGLEFPIGTSGYLNSITLDFTTAPTAAGYINATFQTGYPDNYGLPLTDSSDECTTYASAWWTLTAGNTFAGGTYSFAGIAEGITGISNFNLLHVMSRPQAGSPWTIDGTHAAPTGSAAVPVVNRTGMMQFGDIGITSTGANPLPVTLISFEVKENKGTAKITWSTASESNSAYFMVQRSSNGIDFTDVTRVEAAGKSNVVKDYNAVDLSPYYGTSYYRLHQVDINGVFEDFGPKSFVLKTIKETLKSFTAYPNPFKQDLSISFESLTNENIALYIHTSQGVVVYSTSIMAEKGTNVVELPALDKIIAGTYIITLKNANTKVKQTVIKL